MACNQTFRTTKLSQAGLSVAVTATVLLSGCGEAPREETANPTSGTAADLSPATTVESANPNPATTIEPPPRFVADVSVEELLKTPIDEFPSEMYSVSDCKPVIHQPPEPDPATDYDTTILDEDEIVNEASVILRGRVIDVGAPMTFTPDGVPDEYLEATGASSASDLSLGYTPVHLDIVEVVQGRFKAGEQQTALFFGCWAGGATALTTRDSEVLLLGYESDLNKGISQIAGSQLGLFDWFEIDSAGRLVEGDDIFQDPSRFSALGDRSIDAALTDLREMSTPTSG